MKFSIRTLNSHRKTIPIDSHEKLWANNVSFKAARRKVQETIKNRTSQPESHLKKYSEEMETDIWDFIAYCRSRGIFVVFNISPTWYKLPAHKPEGKTLTEADHRFLALCMALEKTPNCAVIYMKNFKEIDSTLNCGHMLFDTHHMTRKGATVYSKWLSEQMLKNEKVVTALKIPHKPEEFFVKKYAKETWHMVAGYFKKENPVEPEPIQVAEPQTPVIR